MKNLDEYIVENLIELSEDIEKLLEEPKQKGKKNRMQQLSNIHDRMKIYNKFVNSPVYSLRYGK